MSAKIWMEIRDAIKETKPTLDVEFELCRDRDSICAFLETHYPWSEGFPNTPEETWSTQLMTQTPDLIRKGWRT